jgi:hypothetical protein
MTKAVTGELKVKTVPRCYPIATILPAAIPPPFAIAAELIKLAAYEPPVIPA